MPIKTTKYQETPGIKFDHLHMVECAIRLAITDEATTEIKAIFPPYDYDSEGKKVFASAEEIILDVTQHIV